MRTGVFALLALLLVASCGGGTGGRAAPGAIDVAEDPRQAEVAGGAPIELVRGEWTYRATPVASYVLRGVVVGVRAYDGWGSSDWRADVAPVDLAAVWGGLAAGDRWRRLDWSQSGRWIYFRYERREDAPEGNDWITARSSNTHIIPANANLRAAVESLSVGEPFEAEGWLVRVRGEKGSEWREWNSSRIRTDSGDGSCEILYLRRLRARGGVVE